MQIKIVNEHHEVLPYWAETPARQVISLDFHTDTLPAFSRHIAAGNSPPPLSADPDGIRQILPFLRHDEHFDYALTAGIVDQITLISHFNFCESPPLGVIIATPLASPDSLDIDLDDPEFRRRAVLALEDEFLRLRLGDIPSHGYILDIDCDYITSSAALAPKNPAAFRKLAHNAELITFSREEHWVKLLSLQTDELSSDIIIGKIVDLLS